MTDHPDTYARVVKALETTLGFPLGDVSADTSLFNTLGLDSTGVLDLLMNIEDELDVEIETDTLEVTNFATVGSLVSYIGLLRKG